MIIFAEPNVNASCDARRAFGGSAGTCVIEAVIVDEVFPLLKTGRAAFQVLELFVGENQFIDHGDVEQSLGGDMPRSGGLLSRRRGRR